MASFDKTELLFVLSEGFPPLPDGSENLTSAYALEEKIPLDPFSDHSTKAVIVSPWLFQHQATVSQIVKAATLSSVHTFPKLYQVEFQACVDVHFNSKVLQSENFVHVL